MTDSSILLTTQLSPAVKAELLDAAEDDSEDSVSSEAEEVGSVSDDESSLDGYDDQTTSEAAFASLVDCVDRLLKLSMKVRNPAMRTGLSKGYAFSKIVEGTGLDLFDCFADRNIDEEYVKNILQVYNPSLGWRDVSESYLVTRLAKANNQRRRQFAYWSQHRLNLITRDKKNLVKADVKNLSNRDEKAQITKQHSKPTTATHFDFTKVDLNDTGSVVSTMSMNIPDSAALSGDHIVFPDPPEKYASQEGLKEFECPYCATICSRRLLYRREWRHAYISSLFDISLISLQGSCLERHPTLYMHT